jgi:hypothetical protein
MNIALSNKSKIRVITNRVRTEYYRNTGAKKNAYHYFQVSEVVLRNKLRPHTISLFRIGRDESKPSLREDN